jgi:hypothetical protein
MKDKRLSGSNLIINNMLAMLKRLLLFLVGWGVLQAAHAQVKPAKSVFVPACNLQELNQAYVASLNRLRHQLDPHAPVVVFDPALFVGAVLHAARMEQADSLFHASPPALRSAELIGTKRSIQTTDIKELVRFIQTQLQNSERHCAIQSDPMYVYVAVAASKNFYIVRLSHVSSVVYKDERAALAKLGVKEAAVETKQDQRLRFKPF